VNTAIADIEDGQECVGGATALKRRTRLEESPGAAVYLASEAASYVTGFSLTVNGGWTVRCPPVLPRILRILRPA
jgi:NAD(P)-dependent dehydrogenase (short-subunit alcohol dehydrogenase family)